MSYEIRPGRPEDGPRPDERLIYGEHTVGRASFGPRPDGPQVGSYTQGNELSQRVLRRYLLTRAIGASVVRTVQWAGIVTLVLAVLVWLAGVKWLAVLIGIVAVVLLLLRTMLSAVQRRISGVDRMGPAGPAVERLVGQTRRGLRAELRRIGLPSAVWGPVLIGVRLLRAPRRAETLDKLTRFNLNQVVPASTLDELHLLLRNPPAG